MVLFPAWILEAPCLDSTRTVVVLTSLDSTQPSLLAPRMGFACFLNSSLLSVPWSHVNSMIPPSLSSLKGHLSPSLRVATFAPFPTQRVKCSSCRGNHTAKYRGWSKWKQANATTESERKGSPGETWLLHPCACAQIGSTLAISRTGQTGLWLEPRLMEPYNQGTGFYPHLHFIRPALTD